MAELHSNPELAISKSEHSLIVGYRSHGLDKSTPKLILSGKWLREAGFDTGKQVTVKVINDCIVLMAYGEKEQKLLDELKAAQQKLKRIESTLAALH